MPIPQTGRRPLDLDETEIRATLRKRRRQDKIDPFATDPNIDISQLGRLALRRSDINDLFALGDLCAKQSLTEDHRLLVFYVGKTLISYRRAIDFAANDIDRMLARKAIDEYVRWVVDTASQHPTKRNLAVALWAAADDDEHTTETRANHNTALSEILDSYRDQTSSASVNQLDKPSIYDSRDSDRTTGHTQVSLSVSDASMTIADVGMDDDVMSRVESMYSAPSETRVKDDDIPEPTSIEPDANAAQKSILETSSPDKKMPAVDFVTGDRIDGRYEVADTLWGGMGVVYLCYDHEQRAPVAIKSFQTRFLDNERAVTRFTNEAITWIRLEKHRHIVQALLVQNLNGRPHIILEHISGPESMGSDLRSWIDSHRLDLAKTIELALHVALGMQHATAKVSGLVHRDLKPANILVTHEGIAKVTDFGLVRSLDFEELGAKAGDAAMDDSHVNPSDRLTRAGAVVGTAPYMSPEQCQSLEVDARSDIYSFGCVLFEMLTGKRVFHARKFPDWVKAHINEQPAFDSKFEQRLPSNLRSLTLACLEKNPNNRPANWSEIVERLALIYKDVTGTEPILEITGPALEARELMDKGYSLTALNRYEEALKAYDRAIELQPDYAWAWARKGRTLRLLERYEDALACYNHALEIQPRYAWAWNGKGIILERMDRLEEALSCFETATEISDRDVWYWYNRANILQNLERYNEAIPLLERGLALDPSHPNSWAKLGQIHRILHNFADAAQAYEQAIRLDPTYAWAHNGSGLALKALGKTKDALLAFKRATRYQPNEVWHWYNLTEMMVDLGQYEDAVEPARQATQTDPDHGYSWAKFGQVLRYVKRHDEALEAYSRALELEPDSAWAMNGKGIVLEHTERFDEALECYAQAAALKPSDVWHWYNQGNVLALLNRYNDALEPLRQATRIDPDHARSWARKGNALRNLDRLHESLEACIRATEIAPGYSWAWNEAGMTLEAMGRYDDAYSAYRRASETSPNELFYIYKQTDVLIFLHRNEEARDLLEATLQRDSRNPQIWAQHGQIMRRLGFLEDALASYTCAVELDPDHDWAWSGRGLTLSQLKRHEDALHCYQMAIAINPKDVWYWYNLADEQYSLNLLQEAYASLEQALAIHPGHVESWAKQGQTLRRLGKHGEALAAFNKAVQLNSGYAWAWNGRGLTLKEMGRREEALASYERAAAEDPNVSWYFTNQVDILLSFDRKQDALKVVDRAIGVSRNNPTAWARRGQILRRLNRFEDAIQSYDRALDIDKRYAWAWNGKGLCLSALQRHEDALECYKRAAENDNRDVWFWYNYGDTLSRFGNLKDAELTLLRALEINPNHQPTVEKLADIQDQLKKLNHE